MALLDPLIKFYVPLCAIMNNADKYDGDDVVDGDNDDVDDAIVLDESINCKVITVHSPGTLIVAYQLDHCCSTLCS